MNTEQFALIPFRGHQVEAARDAQEVWVVLRRLCDNLGIDYEGQRQRLADEKRAPWSTTCMMQAVAGDGKQRKVFCLHLDTVPMWLATIEISRVRPEVKETLIAYQRECAQVLRDHFFGTTYRGQQDAALREVEVLRHELNALRQEMVVIQNRQVQALQVPDEPDEDIPLTTAQAARLCGYGTTHGLLKAMARHGLKPIGCRPPNGKRFTHLWARAQCRTLLTYGVGASPARGTTGDSAAEGPPRPPPTRRRQRRRKRSGGNEQASRSNDPERQESIERLKQILRRRRE